MYKAMCFGKRMIILLIGLTVLALLAMPASAAMADLDAKLENRQVSLVRYSPDSESTVIGKLENGTELSVTDRYDDFYEIDCFGMTGYIERSQVMVDDNGYYYVNCKEDSQETTTLSGTQQNQVQILQGKAVVLSEEQLGVPYVWGGTSPAGFDCSGFVQYIFDELGYTLNRTATAQLEDGLIVDPEDLQPGDLVFFEGTTSEDAISSHVGIYVGDEEFIHASSRGISYSSLDEEYYADSFLCARRVILTGVMAYQQVQETNRFAGRSSGHYGRNFLFAQMLKK